MKNQIVLKVDGGVVDYVSIPKNTEVIVRDYDTDGIDSDLLQFDEDGIEFVEIIFEGK